MRALMNTPRIQRGLPTVGRGAEADKPCPAQTLRSPGSCSSLQSGPNPAGWAHPVPRVWTPSSGRRSPSRCCPAASCPRGSRPWATPPQPSCSLLASPEAASLLRVGASSLVATESSLARSRAQPVSQPQISAPRHLSNDVWRTERPPTPGPASQLPAAQGHPAWTPHGLSEA